MVAAKRRVVAGIVGGLMGLSMAGVAGAQEVPIREPLLGLCLRPVLGSGSLIDLPLVNIPGGSIPHQPIALVLGGQFDDCR